MKTKLKALALVIAAMLLVSASVFGTMAYLTAQDAVSNSFTVGNVTMSLDESDVNPDGTVIAGAERVRTNDYKLIPGHDYTKDPIVHFAEGSEASWLFVKVENGIAAIESTADDYASIEDQIIANHWTPLEGNAGVYFMKVDAAEADVDYKVFTEFSINGALSNDDLAPYAGAAVNVTAYAVQCDGFETAQAAWDIVKGN